jgi:hypothetical protein
MDEQFKDFTKTFSINKVRIEIEKFLIEKLKVSQQNIQ